MNFVQENYQNHDDRTCGDATKPEPKLMTCFQQNLTPEQFDQVIAVHPMMKTIRPQCSL